jgi:hypothetical protein
MFSFSAVLGVHAKEVVASESDAQDEQDDTCNQAAFPEARIGRRGCEAELLTDQHSCDSISLSEAHQVEEHTIRPMLPRGLVEKGSS